MIAVQEYWPVVAAVRNTGLSIDPIPSAWFQSVMRSPMAFYCFISAASLHHRYLRKGGDGKEALLLRLSYRTQALQLIQQDLGKGGHPTDDLLMSILVLAAHSPTLIDEFPEVKEISKSPLATAQSLDLHGSISYGASHLEAVKRLLRQRGGINTVRMTGLAEMIT
jgi:hypothetical protein